jgi:hypothetical protein
VAANQFESPAHNVVIGHLLFRQFRYAPIGFVPVLAQIVNQNLQNGKIARLTVEKAGRFAFPQDVLE